jgi:hypothetical protein
MNSTIQPNTPEGFGLGLTHGERGALERRRIECLKVLRVVFELCQETNPTSPGTNCTLTRDQIATHGKLSGIAVERGMASLRSSRVIYTRWLRHNRWEVHFKASIVRKILAASFSESMILIEEQWKLRQQVVLTPLPKTPSREGASD